MFTGLVEEVGTLLARRGTQVTLLAPFIAPTLKLGDSVAVNGICLTATTLGGDRFTADISESTLDVTTARTWQAGRRLNLERAMALGDRLGGHLVSGHVDGVGRLVSRTPLGEAHRLAFEMPGELATYLVPKGSITIDGTSLTVNEVSSTGFTVTLIPHTGAKTTLLSISPGDAVNLEVDLIAKYVRRMLAGFLDGGAAPAGAPKGLSYEQLARCGFLE
ncbi:riboflavin synthase [bacterium]|nr:riboflavin synthase [bacterium]